MQIASLIRLLGRFEVSEMRAVARDLDPGGEVSRDLPSGNPSVNQMAGDLAEVLTRKRLIREPLFDRLAEARPGLVSEVEAERTKWSIYIQAERAEARIGRASRDAETSARGLEKIQRELEQARKSLELAMSTAARATRDLNDTVDRALATEQSLVTLRSEADEAVVGIRAIKREAETIVEGLRELSPDESKLLERKREEEPDRFDTGDVVRPKMGGLLWPAGVTLRVRFLGGSELQRANTRQAAAEWSRYANVRFEFVGDNDAEIRVSFDPALGSWAFLGTNALGVAPPKPTANFGYADIDPSTALHELGHVLGLIHEFQSPKADIPWNLEGVYQDLAGPPNHWTRERIDQTMIDRYSEEDYPDYRAFDPGSIMMFDLPARWVTGDKGYAQSKTLTESDKAFIGRLYPFPDRADNAPGAEAREEE